MEHKKAEQVNVPIVFLPTLDWNEEDNRFNKLWRQKADELFVKIKHCTYREEYERLVREYEDAVWMSNRLHTY